MLILVKCFVFPFIFKYICIMNDKELIKKYISENTEIFKNNVRIIKNHKAYGSYMVNYIKFSPTQYEPFIYNRGMRMNPKQILTWAFPFYKTKQGKKYWFDISKEIKESSASNN